MALAVITLAAGEASAYCRTAVCGEEVGKRCEPPEPDDCGIAIAWPTACVGYSVQRDASDQVELAAVTDLAARAFATWTAATCGGQPVGIAASDLGPVTCDQQEFDQESKNQNLIVFRDSSWPYGPGALALTTVTYALDTGEIRDGDIELNSKHASFTTSDGDVDVDLLSILTHEAGHFLGMAHSPVTDATMQTDYPPKSISLRTLEADDVAGICAVYPPGGTAACDPEPLNGLGDECGEAASAGDDGCGCEVAGEPTSAPTWALLGVAAAGVSAAASRRRRPRGAAPGRRPPPGSGS